MMTPAAAACVACGGSAFSEIKYPADGVRPTTVQFDCIRICAACGLGQALPRYPQSNLDAFYADGDYWGGLSAGDVRQALHERNQCRHRVDVALPFAPANNPLRVLDVGAGHGWISDWLDSALRGRTLTYDFIEPDAAMSALITRRAAGRDVRRLRGWSDAGAGYDLIFLNHVLEHVADPLDLLAGVRRKLAPGAAAYIEVPNADYRFKQNVFPHTFFFTPGALAHLASRAGLVVKGCDVFGRLPAGPATLPLRAAYRFAATAGLQSLAGWLDDRLWHYRAASDGIWIRWLIGTAA